METGLPNGLSPPELHLFDVEGVCLAECVAELKTAEWVNALHEEVFHVAADFVIAPRMVTKQIVQIVVV